MEDWEMIRTGFDGCKRLALPATFALFALTGLVGCQVDVGGQTLPSPYYLSDDVQYFPPGTEFKLSREAAAMQAAAAEAGPAGQAPAGPVPGMGGPLGGP